jgi:hypothetical protein
MCSIHIDEPTTSGDVTSLLTGTLVVAEIRMAPVVEF